MKEDKVLKELELWLEDQYYDHCIYSDTKNFYIAATYDEVRKKLVELKDKHR